MSIRTLLLPLKRKLRANQSFYFRFGRVFGLYRNAIMGSARLLGGIDDNLVVFASFDYRSYNDSPRYISEMLHKVRPETRIVWLFKDGEAARQRFQIPDYVQIYESIENRGVRALARARVVVDNYNQRYYLNFPGKNQIYIQTWHGDRPFKVIGYDAPLHKPKIIEEFCSLFLSGSDFGERIIRRSFRCRGEIMKQGMPRNDLLVRNDPAERSAIRARLGLSEDVRVLIYAPTFRDSEIRAHKQQHVPLDLFHVLDTLERTTGSSWKCLVRAHYMSCGIPMDDDSGRLIPASDYPEMTELLLASDALLTDYSSCAGDFVLLGRPIYLYQSDIDAYQTNDRAFYIDMKEYPYWIASTQEELDALIEATTPERVQENCRAIMDFYGMNETGHATEAVVDYIISKLKGKSSGRRDTSN